MESPERARAWEEQIAIPTYDREPDSPHPPFLQNIYPYTVFGKTLSNRRSRNYRAIQLENRYLALTVVPELGGRVISMVEKRTGREILYHNHVVKPGQVDARNAWIAGGLEFSFPIAHTLTCLDSVDAIWQEHKDGSASVYFGETERLYRMRWLVELRLPADRALVEVFVRLYNPTPFRHRWQYWSNAAVYATPGMEFVYPMKYAYVHSHEQCIVAWPWYRDIDRSWFRNNDRMMGTFSKDCREDFFGIYDHDTDAGVVHWADHREVPGKKTWTWGNGQDATVWASTLSDEDGPYCEIQSGRCETQVEFNWLEPRQSLQWEEVWYPVSGIGGFCYAGRDGAISIQRQESGLEIGVCLNREVSDGRLAVTSGAQVIHERAVELGPGQGLREVIPAQVSESSVRVRVTDESGQHILECTCIPQEPADEKELERLNEEASRKAPEPQTAEEFYVQGIGLEKGGNPRAAEESYQAALERDASHSAALTARAILHLKASEPAKAEEMLRKALQRDRCFAEARYYLSLSLRYQNRLDEAESELWMLVRTGTLEDIACAQLGEIAIIQEKYETARAMFNRALSRNPQDTRSVVLLALCMRKLGRSVEAGMGLEIASRIDPLDPMVPSEHSFLQTDKEWEETGEFQALKPQLDRSARSWLELALVYSELGLLLEATYILAHSLDSRNLSVARDPIISCHLADFTERIGGEQPAREFYARAMAEPPDYVFPHCIETIPVLERAIGKFDADAKARYYLGNLYFAVGRSEDAVRVWMQSAELFPGFSVVHRNLGLAFWKRFGKPEEAAAHYERALLADPDDSSLVIALDQLYAEIDRTSPKRQSLLEKALAADEADDGIAERLAAYFLDAGMAERALELLITRRFAPKHGSSTRQSLYTAARIRLGETAYEQGDLETARSHFQSALDFPESLGEDEPIVKSNPTVESWLGKLSC